MARNTRATASNVVPLYDDEALATDVGAELDEDAANDDTGAALDGPLQPEPEGLTTTQKVGVGAGAVGALGLLGFGLYKLGVRLGWWGASAGVIVIDDLPKPSDGSSEDSSKPSGGGSRSRAIGKPPNISGDPEGYNTDRFPHPGAVRLTMTTLGYKVAYNAETLVPNNEPHAEVKRFQNNWNAVIRGLDSGRVKFPTTVEDPTKLRHFRGLLAVDGIPGKNTLNAMEIAFNNWFKNKVQWMSLVEQA